MSQFVEDLRKLISGSTQVDIDALISNYTINLLQSELDLCEPLHTYTNALLKACSLSQREKLIKVIHCILMQCSTTETFDWSSEEYYSSHYGWFFDVHEPYKRIMTQEEYSAENID